MLGSPSPKKEALLIKRLAQDMGAKMIGGHSRGAQVAWRVAGMQPMDKLFLIDPVDGSGPNPQTAKAALNPASFTADTLVIGAQYGGRCAPDKVNHRLFARMAPPDSEHVVLPMGHLDVMDSNAHRLGRWLCGSGKEPDLMRKKTADLILKQLTISS